MPVRGIDFTHARTRELTHFRNNLGGSRCGTPTRDMHDAVRARIVAAILQPSRQRAWEILTRTNGGQKRATCSPGNQARRP